MKTSVKCFPRVQRSCVPEITKLVPSTLLDLVMCKSHLGGTGFEDMKGS